MTLILNIDTATETAGVCLSRDGVALVEATNPDQKNHAGFIQPAIQQLMAEAGISLNQVDAISVTEGPGSYTGLRVGMATAKGLCFTLGKPLILVNTLEVMAYASRRNLAAISLPDGVKAGDVLLCPMIDARRMEVFTAVYTTDLKPVMAASALILSEESFKVFLDKQPVVFSGSGHEKFMTVSQHSNSLFSGVRHESSDLAALASIAFRENKTADLAYSEPFYLKEFFNPASGNLKPV